MKSMWEMKRQGLLDKLRKVEEELVMVKDGNKQVMKKKMIQLRIRMDRKAVSNFKTTKNNDIVEKLLRFVNFPEDKVGMMVETGRGGQVDSEVKSGEEMVREFLKLTKFPTDKEMVEQFIQAEDFKK